MSQPQQVNMTVEQALEMGMQQHQAGQLQQAESIYRQVLTAQPNNPNALHLLGVVALQVGRLEVAEKLLRQAIRVHPNAAQFHANLGQVLANSGRHHEALAAYKQAVALQPDFAEAAYNLGTIAQSLGQTDLAIEALRQAVKCQPNFPEACNNLGNALRGANQLDAAIAEFRKAVEQRPIFPGALNNLGSALQSKGNLDGAIEAYRQAITLQPDFADAHNNLGTALQAHGQIDQAIASFRAALAARPEFPDAWNNMGIALREQGIFDEAIQAFRKAVAQRPAYAEAFSNLGNAYHERGRFDEAIAAFERALAIRPNYPEALSNLGNTLQEKGQTEEALGVLAKAIELKPRNAEAAYNRGKVLRSAGRLDAAAEAYRQAIEWRADFVSAKFNLALTQLLQGSFVEGFTGFEARWDLPDLAKTRQHFSQPQWDGSDLNGRTILLHAEQGIGDTIQFIRYAPLVAQRGGRVVFQCPEAMTRLFEGFPGIDRFVVRGRELPEFDLHCPLLSLPLAMKTTLETIPASVPYLSADAESVSRWRKRLPRDSVNVGLAWAGRAEHSNDRLRSMALTDFAPLVDAPGVNFFSLQKGDAAEQLHSTPDGLAITDWTEQLQDLSDTAALMDALDLVITVDTSVAHLAGALGKPVWVLLPFAPDWRWMLDRSDSPWYPTMRLFRQPQARDWRSPVEQVAQALHTFQVPAR